MWFAILQTIWLGLPAAVSNIAPAVGTRFFPHFLNIPMDFNKTFKDKPILGENKTVRGFVFGVLLGELIFLLQQAVAPTSFLHSLHILPYNHLPWYFGFLFGIGALGGDSVKSFFKRQVGIPPGKTWLIFDQVDWIIGAFFFLLLFVKIPIQIIVIGLTFGIILHALIKFVGFTLGIGSQPI